MGLVRKQLIRPDRPEFAGEDAFRFAHALIREVAYAGLPKRLRADLHERLAGWLKTKPRVPDEILGYHLEQAFRLRLEIGAAGEQDRALAAEAADRLATAARAARTRGDAAAGADCSRAPCRCSAATIPAHRAPVRARRGPRRGRPARGRRRFLSEAIERAALEHDARTESRALVDQQLVRLHAGTSGGHEHARRVADVALAHLEQTATTSASAEPGSCEPGSTGSSACRSGPTRRGSAPRGTRGRPAMSASCSRSSAGARRRPCSGRRRWPWRSSAASRSASRSVTARSPWP